MNTPIHVWIDSEIGKLDAVIIHRPGVEVENMDPENAEKALYSDILNLTVARREYDDFAHVLGMFAETLEIAALLEEVLTIETVKASILQDLVSDTCVDIHELLDVPPKLLADALIEGILLERNTLTKFLSEETYSLRPLHNFLFIRDAAMVLGDTVLVGSMASRVRHREARIMDAVFAHHPRLKKPDVLRFADARIPTGITIEGGDVLMAREDILIIGAGARTTPQGIDFITANWPKKGISEGHILVQELPRTPESFIHLDMVFTLLGPHDAMVYEPLILKSTKLRPIHITLSNGNVVSIQEEDNLICSLAALGMDLSPICCGGTNARNQKREQWHSGANFFAIEPNKVIGYGRNEHTIEAMNHAGFDVLNAKDIIEGRVNVSDHQKCVITISGAELARGGGGVGASPSRSRGAR